MEETLQRIESPPDNIQEMVCTSFVGTANSEIRMAGGGAEILQRALREIKTLKVGVRHEKRKRHTFVCFKDEKLNRRWKVYQ